MNKIRLFHVAIVISSILYVIFGIWAFENTSPESQPWLVIGLVLVYYSFFDGIRQNKQSDFNPSSLPVFKKILFFIFATACLLSPFIILSFVMR